MGLFSKKVAEADVEFGRRPTGLEQAEPAAVHVQQHQKLGGKEPLPMLGSLGAVRLLSMLRREELYVGPFMVLAKLVADALTDEDLDPATFDVRGCTDKEIGDFNAEVESMPGLDPMWTSWTSFAYLRRALPTLADELLGEKQAGATLELQEGRNGIGFVKFKIGVGGDAKRSVAAWAATVERLVRDAPREKVAVPIGGGLKALRMVWEQAGCPREVGVREGSEIEVAVTDVTARFTPD